ncbi:MAG: ATP-dependent DNA helicase [Puniceicoccales bacterium]|jgi:ATP-dependent DNA helicase DinG|nr:ATP-dependent DNA helicase [Puniceicoccales bacterium]
MIGLLVEHGGGAPVRRPILTLTPRIFANHGWLHEVLQLPHRPQQAAFAAAAAHAFDSDTPLLCEAGTGVGKSLAYLIPGIIHAMDTARQLVVATYTIPLQEQIQSSDLVKCRQLFERVPELHRYAAFKTALLVGKANYLCSTRLARALSQRAELLESTQQDELRLVSEWARSTQTGLRQEIPARISPEVWEWVNADSSLCGPRNCNPATCPYQRARARIASANVIIVNHALLLSLINAGAAPAGKDTRGILYADDFAVLDEAHRLPDVATDHFGSRVTTRALEKQLKMLWNPKSGRGLLASFRKKTDSDLVVNAILAGEFFFNDIRARFLENAHLWRQREPNWIDPTLNEPLCLLISRLNELAKREADLGRKDEIEDARRRLDSLNSALNDAISLGEAPDFVYWVERSGVRGQNISVNKAPLDVSAELRTHLFQRKTSVVLTSATLAAGNSMERFQEQTGALNAAALIEKSPFDYRRNMEIFIATDAPAPDRENGGALATDWLTKIAATCVERVPSGGTLILCTSHGDVRRLNAVLTEHFSGTRCILAQIDGANRARLVQDFRENGTAVLIGTDSFWTGVDVPGPALSQIIMTRLPFENPSHPIAEARTEWLAGKGKNPFAEMSLPAALIKFRQGIGRLIRKTDDRGRLVILDSRVLTKTYGRHFAAALPHTAFTRFSGDTLAVLPLVYR